MREDFAAQVIDWRVIRGCLLGGHVLAETRDQIIHDARQFGPVSIGDASLGLAIKFLSVAKVSVHEAGEQHSPKKRETKCACILITPVESRWRQSMGVGDDFVAPNWNGRFDRFLQSLVEFANTIGQSRMMAGYRVGDNVRHDAINVRHDAILVRSRKLHNFLGARRRVVDLVAAFETPLKRDRIFAEIVQKAREQRRICRPEFLAIGTT